MRSRMDKIGSAFCVLAVLLMSITAGAVSADDKSPVAAEPDPDVRIMLSLPNDERILVLEEMRAFVVAVQTIFDGLAKKDFAQVSQAAKKMGSGAANEIPDRVVKKLPQTFIQLANNVHTSLDAIALDALDLEDANHVAGQMAELMKNCIACHLMYQVNRLSCTKECKE